MNSSGGGVKNTYIELTPQQSVGIHGWLNPKRALCWHDVANNPSITIERLLERGITVKQMRSMQPDIYEWMNVKGASFEHVPALAEFPLHPIQHLQGDMSTLAQMKYPPKVLLTLGLDFEKLQELHQMDPRWMKMLGLHPNEWMDLGMTTDHVNEMTEGEVLALFGISKKNLLLSMGMIESMRGAALCKSAVGQRLGVGGH